MVLQETRTLISAVVCMCVHGVAGDKDPDFQEIKGKKVMGVGLGNIFQGGPIKLRNTNKKAEASKPSKADEKVGTELHRN